MYANSTAIRSAQTGPHEHLVQIVRRHAVPSFRKPLSGHALAAFDTLRATWDGRAPLVLDAGCGVGWSTLRLAREMPDALVLGVDRSAHRLARGKPGDILANCLFLRTDLTDFWRILAREGVRLSHHFLLYPNPWPKVGQIGRRWHASPVFPYVLQLGGQLECRSNWRVYLEEMAQAIGLLRGCGACVEPFDTQDPVTPFERKYRDSGQTLYRLRADLR